MNQTNYLKDRKHNSGLYGSGVLLILPIIFVIILVGNILLLLAIKSFRFRRVPDMLVGSLAVIDPLNDLGPVLTSIVVFQTVLKVSEAYEWKRFVIFTTGCLPSFVCLLLSLLL